MKQIKGVIAAIQADPAHAVDVLRTGLEANLEGVLVELAAFVIAALEGTVPDP